MPAPTLTSAPPSLQITAVPLTPQSFAPFGAVIASPFPRDLATPPSDLSSLSQRCPHLLATPVSANQGSAVKISPVTPLADGYRGACCSGRPAEARMSMFSCFPRRLRPSSTVPGQAEFDVRILERHPYTTQTFIPLDLSSQTRVLRNADTDVNGVDAGRAEFEPIYLVIVAPSLKGQSATAISSTGKTVSISDPPDLSNIRAFIARGGQAVTYAAGTWHAPMVVLGTRRVDFVVVQYVNGVEDEDCQEAAFGNGIAVVLRVPGSQEAVKAKL